MNITQSNKQSLTYNPIGSQNQYQRGFEANQWQQQNQNPQYFNASGNQSPIKPDRQYQGIQIAGSQSITNNQIPTQYQQSNNKILQSQQYPSYQAQFPQQQQPYQPEQQNQLNIQQYQENQQQEVEGKDLSSLTAQGRMGFVRKVYSILSIQIFITAVFAYSAVNISSFQSFVKTSQFMLVLVIIGLFSSLCCVSCVRENARKVPLNYILLLAFTLCESYLVAYVCAQIADPMIVYQAFAMTCAIFIGLTLYAMITDTDFTFCTPFVLAVLMILIIAGLFMQFSSSNTTQILYSCLCALIFCVFIIINTQQIVGNSAQKYSIDDYVLAAIDLYIDFIGLLLRILVILSRTNQ